MSRIKGPLSIKSRSRIKSVFLISLIIYGFLIYRISYISIFKGEEYSNRVERQSTEKVSLNSGRGIIYDRNNVKLTDTEKETVLLIPNKILSGDHDNINLIKEATNLSDEDIYKAVQDQLLSNIIEIEVDKINKDKTEDLEQLGIIIEEKTIRYSDKNLLTHTIGYLKKFDQSAQSGIEKNLDDILKDNNEEYVSVFKAADSGKSQGLDILDGSIKTVKDNDTDKHIKLTIDSKIQKIVEDVVDKESNPTAVVISDIETGEILSICSRPNYNQNNIANYINSTNRELENRAISVTYPPGSVFKLVVLYAALSNGIIDDSYTYNCTGKTTIGDTEEILHCHKADGHGIESLEDAFANSCNPAFLDIAMKVGKEKIIEAVKTLHLDESVGIGLEEEVSSNIPDEISIRNLAIGQADIEFTPIQINQLTQIIANNGTYKPLYMYDSIINNDKNIIKKFQNSKSEEIISPYIMTKIKEIMKSVSKDGTAKELNDLDSGCGVKTGTAQSSLNGVSITHGWITGFYPSDNAKYAITVLVEGTENESKSAIPIFKEICNKINK
ncbi:peptidoglycan D,D-transpeptidase FtsI family protein [Romboutsia sp. 1001713B170207_170306_H8]|uniref:peptidoglycan D,D-transpeptidase FtsI family protein n=1 Tax=Romboutsia sp. 1001713B170207_170306_H8 TaxID=2787112 RepID=UPI000821188E|nr:penicillin-binding protein 2 [Romboutsia sp. 1001713B170207_170306_H8]SCH10807.1 Penicillin-binding protein A [uncultured Clostridium sp.]